MTGSRACLTSCWLRQPAAPGPELGRGQLRLGEATRVEVAGGSGQLAEPRPPPPPPPRPARGPHPGGPGPAGPPTPRRDNGPPPAAPAPPTLARQAAAPAARGSSGRIT